MKIIDLLKNEKVCISCELFPPKAGTELQNALNIVSDIAEVGPHFMSVTYGAGGTSVGQTVAIARAIEASGRPALAHLTCIDAESQDRRCFGTDAGCWRPECFGSARRCGEWQ